MAILCAPILLVAIDEENIKQQGMTLLVVDLFFCQYAGIAN